ncbi:MAG: uroporphyrinogen decarboxylase family protein [Candidatus Aminicenantes bacterium]|nr:uroporphyrinogen decarboxylase family protein [Candidatus Aminicenantes bacterium]
MTSKERVLRALNHKEPDRIPMDFGGTAVTGMHVAIVSALRDRYSLEKRPVKVHEPYQMLGLIEDDLQRALGLDVEGVYAVETMFGFRNENWTPWRLDSGLEVLVSEHFKTTKDANGDTLVYPKSDLSAPPSARLPKDGFFFDTIVRQEPIDDAKLDPADNLEEFGPISDRDLDYFDEATKAAAQTGRAVIATFGGLAFGDIALVPAPFLKYPKGIRDIEEWYISTLTRPSYVHAIFEKQTEIALANLEKIAARVGDRVQAVFVCGTDFGTQQSTFCSADTFRSLYAPYYKRVNAWIHKHTAWKTFKHSCGAVKTLIPAIIEAGFDILNPVQCSAAGMDPAALKAEYGSDLVFWGGGVDTQKTLMFGTPAAVRGEVLSRCEIFGRGGGFIFNAVHNIQANVPIANVTAMFDAFREFHGMR